MSKGEKVISINCGILYPPEVVGGKGSNLLRLSEKGYPVPDGFIIDADVFFTFIQNFELPFFLKSQIIDQISKINAISDASYGDETNDLCFSVRSSPIFSMPGKLNSILNVGMSSLIKNEKDQAMRDTYTDNLLKVHQLLGLGDISNVFLMPAIEQLFYVIELLYKNWEYEINRSKLDISGLGFPIIIQRMINTNLSTDSFSAVVFTSNPVSGKEGLFGEYIEQTQDELVSGKGKIRDIGDLKKTNPSLFYKIRKITKEIKDDFDGVDQDIELSVVGDQIFVLQTRNLVFAKSHEENIVTEVQPYFEGIAASPGFSQGYLVFNEDQYNQLSHDQNAIFLQTSPNDFCMQHIDDFSGVIFLGGGSTSHVSILSRLSEVPCIMGVDRITETQGNFFVNNELLEPFSKVTIDGTNGLVYLGWFNRPKINNEDIIEKDPIEISFSDLVLKLESMGIDINILYNFENKVYFSKSVALRLLETYGLSIPKLFNLKNLPKEDLRFSIRTSFAIESLFQSNRRIGYNMPSRFNLKREHLASAFDYVKKEFSELYGESPDIIIHETHKASKVGNVEINRDNGSITIESWVNYDKKEPPSITNINMGTQKVLLSNDTFLPGEALNIPFRNYILEWVITDDGNLIFTDLSIIKK